jgi:hypothetical protein
MFKYIKKLISVVLMFAVIIVFSTSKVFSTERGISRDANFDGMIIVNLLSVNGQLKEGSQMKSTELTGVGISDKNKDIITMYALHVSKLSNAQQKKVTGSLTEMWNRNITHINVDGTLGQAAKRMGFVKPENMAKAFGSISQQALDDEKLDEKKFMLTKKVLTVLGYLEGKTSPPTPGLTNTLEIKMDDGKFYEVKRSITLTIGNTFGKVELTDKAKTELSKAKAKADALAAAAAAGGEGGGSGSGGGGGGGHH